MARPPAALPPLIGRWQRRLGRVAPVRARRRRFGAGRRPKAPELLAATYRALACAQPGTARLRARDALRVAATPRLQLDAAFAAVAAAVARGEVPRMRGLVTFLERCYPAPELAQALTRMRRRLAVLTMTAGWPALSPLTRAVSWPDLAAAVRAYADALPAPAAPPMPGDRWRTIALGPVVLRPAGGMGNQMFQYAAAACYARRFDRKLRLDLGVYESRAGYRELLLDRLRAPVRRASDLELASALRRRHREEQSALDTDLFEDPAIGWMAGFWEDERYFADQADYIRRAFQPRDPDICRRGEAIVAAARAGGPVVALHIRRGDRAAGPAAAPFATQPMSYYREAAARFAPGSSFLVFSDTPSDIEWCRANLGLPETAHVAFADGTDPVLDMFAMAACDHLVISAGTFSWWAAWLGARPGRRVIAPDPVQAMGAARCKEPACPQPLPEWEVLRLYQG